MTSVTFGCGATRICSIRKRHGFTARTRSQRGQDRISGISKETNGAIAEQEMCSTRMRAPEMEHAALVVKAPGPEMVRSTRAHLGEQQLWRVHLACPEHRSGRTQIQLGVFDVPPAKKVVSAWGALPN